MIELINVSKYYPTEFGRHYVFRNVSLKLPLDKSVGVLGPNGAGKSTFLRLLGGADAPSEGRIIKTGSISPPMGLTPSLQRNLTASENMRFAGRIYGLDRDEINETIEFVRNLTGIGKFFDLPVSTYSSGMRSRVAFAINISLSFDFYLFDELSAGGDKEFRKITAQMVEQRLKTSKFIVASHRVEELLELCDTGIIIQNGELTYFDSIKDAVLAYGDTEGLDQAQTSGAKTSRRKAKKTAAVDGEGAASEDQSPEDLGEKKKRFAEAVSAARLAKRQQAQAAADAAPVPAPGTDTNLPAPKPRRSRKARPVAADSIAIAAPAIAEAPAPEASASPETVKSDDAKALIRAARAERRRAKKLSLVEEPAAAEAAPDAAASSIHPLLSGAAATAVAAEATPKAGRRRRKNAATGSGTSSQTPDGTALAPPEASADLSAAVPQAGGKRLLKILNHQALAQVHAAEALALLLDLLDRQPAEDGYAARIVDAQRHARRESARARALLEAHVEAASLRRSGEEPEGSNAVPAHNEVPSRFLTLAERPDLNL